MQLTVKADCFQIEFGMIAGLPRRSCRCPQSAKVGIKATAMERVAMFAGSWILDELPVMTLPDDETLRNYGLHQEALTPWYTIVD